MKNPAHPLPSGRILFVNRYFAPDESATSQLLTDLAVELSARGERVAVICSRQLYGDAGALLPRRESIAGVEVRRVWSTRFGRQRLLGRAMDYLTFYLSSFCALVGALRRDDVLVAKTDPPLLSVPAALAARLRGAALVNWLQDLFPEVAEQLGVKLPFFLPRLLRALRNASLRAADTNVVLSARMAQRLESLGVASSRIRIIENWAEQTPLPPRPVAQSDLRARLGLAGKYVVGYAGNLGRAHDFHTLLGAADLLRGDPDIMFLMIGGGAGMEGLQQGCALRDLPNFCFLPYQPRGALADTLAAADVHWLSLKPALEGLIVPSKFYGILTAARPVVFIGDARGELAREIAAAGCGAAVQIGESAQLAELLLAWKCAPALRERLGAAGLRRYTDRFAAARAFEAWRDVSRRVGRPAADYSRLA